MNDAQLSTLRHQLRNQLNTISVNAELIKLLAQSEQTGEQIMTSADRILKECKDCAAVLGDSDTDKKTDPSDKK